MLNVRFFYIETGCSPRCNCAISYFFCSNVPAGICGVSPLRTVGLTSVA